MRVQLSTPTTPKAEESGPTKLGPAIKKNKNKRARHKALARKQLIRSLFLFLAFGELIKHASASSPGASEYYSAAQTQLAPQENIILQPVLNIIPNPFLMQTPALDPTSSFTYDDIHAGEVEVTQLNKFNIDRVTILDFWGEGRIVEGDLVTGFPNAYNVNHQHQKISNGHKQGKPIPNLIPTMDYEDTSIERFVTAETFQYVTVMGAPVTKDTAEEMHRVAEKSDEARILFYGSGSTHIQRIQEAAQDDFIYMQHSVQYAERLDSALRAVSIRPINPMVPIRQVLRDLNIHIQMRDLTSAESILRDLHQYCSQGYSQTASITNHVDRLLRGNNTDSLVDEIRLIGSQRVATDVVELLPAPREEFRVIFDDPLSYLIAATVVRTPDFDIFTLYEPDETSLGLDVILAYYHCANELMQETGATFIHSEDADHLDAHSSDPNEDDVTHSHLKFPRNYISPTMFGNFINRLDQCNFSHLVLSPYAARYAHSAFESCDSGIDTTRCMMGYNITSSTPIDYLRMLHRSRHLPVSAPTQRTLTGSINQTLFGRYSQSQTEQEEQPTIDETSQFSHST